MNVNVQKEMKLKKSSMYLNSGDLKIEYNILIYFYFFFFSIF